MGNFMKKYVRVQEGNVVQAETQPTDKDALLIKAVEESDVMTVTRMVKCVHELDPDILYIADEIAQEKGHGTVIKLIGLAKEKINIRKNTGGSYETYSSTEKRQSLSRSWSPSTIMSLKEMVIKSTAEVWVSMEMNEETYSAPIVMMEEHLLLKSLSKMIIPPADAIIISYHKVKSLFERNHITVFLEINLPLEDSPNFIKRFVHIILIGFEGRTQQFKCMCTGEIDGISYANTTFLDIVESPVSVVWAGARNDGDDTALPGFSAGNMSHKIITPGLVAGFYHSSEERNPTHFAICTEGNSYYAEDHAIGEVVQGLSDIQMVYEQAKLHGPSSIKIYDCGIVLD